MPKLSEIAHFQQLQNACLQLYRRYGLNFDPYVEYSGWRDFLGLNFAEEDAQTMKDFLIVHRNALRGQMEAFTQVAEDMLVILARDSFFALNHNERVRAAQTLLDVGIHLENFNIQEGIAALDAEMTKTAAILDLVTFAISTINITIEA